MKGNDVNIWRDKWIMNYRLGDQGELGGGLSQKVSEIINEREKVWKLDVIKEKITKA